MDSPLAVTTLKAWNLAEPLSHLTTALEAAPANRFGLWVTVQACVLAMQGLEEISRDQDTDPRPVLRAAFRRAQELTEALAALARDLRPSLSALQRVDDASITGPLFESAWTGYSADTYDHSVQLVLKRLRASGLDEPFFRGKECFDGGCGTGRLSVAMAMLGARRVVAADIGAGSLDYLRKVTERMRLPQIEIVQTDITDLRRWPDASFDFVASNGVLHHTEHPSRGLAEHVRILRSGATFWLYLYGADGVYWTIYDTLRPAIARFEIAAVTAALQTLGIREGMVYTFLDNFLAPRVYVRREPLLRELAESGITDVRDARGTGDIDDTAKLLSTRFGPAIYGPDGEMRLVMTKI